MRSIKRHLERILIWFTQAKTKSNKGIISTLQYKGEQVYKSRYEGKCENYKPVIKRFSDVDGEPLYRVRLMGFVSEQEARDFKNCHNLKGAFIVRN